MSELRRILHIEDDPSIQSVTKLALEAVGGFEVLSCSSGAEALREAPGFAPDFVLLDVMMPGMDGFALAEAVRDGIRRVAEGVAANIGQHNRTVESINAELSPRGAPLSATSSNGCSGARLLAIAA